MVLAPGVVAVIAIIGVEFVVIGALVTYLLIRRQDADKKPLQPKGPVSTSYDESDGPKRNGDIILDIPNDIADVDDEKKPLPSSSESATPHSTPDSNKKLITEPENVAINVDHEEEIPRELAEEDPLTEVRVVDEETIEPRLVNEGIEKEPPGTPPPPFEDKKGHSSDEDVITPEAMDLIVPQVLREPVVSKQPVEDVLERKDSSSSSFSSSGSEDELLPEKELSSTTTTEDEDDRVADSDPLVEEEVVVPRKNIAPYEENPSSSVSRVDSIIDKLFKITHRDELEGEKPIPKKRRDVDEDLIVPKSELEPKTEMTSMLRQQLTTSDEEDIVPKKTVKPRKRRKMVTEPPVYVSGSAQTEQLKSTSPSSESVSEDDATVPKVSRRTIAIQTDKIVPPPETSSSSESDIEDYPVAVESMSTQTADLPERVRSRRKKTQTPASLRSRTLSPASTQTPTELPPRRAMSPMSTQTIESRISSSGSSISGSERRMRRPFRARRTVGELVMHYESPAYKSPSSSTHSSFSAGRGTQTWVHERSRIRKDPNQKRKIVVTMADMQTQTQTKYVGYLSSTTSYTSSESESEDEEPEVMYVYEKGIQVNLSDCESEDETDKPLGSRLSSFETGMQRGTQTPNFPKTKKIQTPRQPETPVMTSRKISLIRRKSEPVAQTVSTGTGTETDPNFKSEAHVHFMASPTTVVFAAPSTPRKNIVFTSAWGRPVKLEDLHKAGLVDDKTKEGLENGEIQPDDANVIQQLKPYLEGNQPVAGILLLNTGEKISVNEAVKRNIIRRGNAINILEAQVATGSVIDPKTGIRMSVEDAAKVGLIGRRSETVLKRAQQAVSGYNARGQNKPLSVYEAIKSGDVVEKHGIRLLEAQLATGGIIDPKANHRVPTHIAYEYHLCDRHLMRILDNPSEENKGFYDPNTDTNITYRELMSRCITDLDTGVLLLPLDENLIKSRQKAVQTDAQITSETICELHQTPTSPDSVFEYEDPGKYKSQYYRTEARRDIKGGYLKEVIIEAVVQKMAQDEAIEEAERQELEEEKSLKKQIFAPVTVKMAAPLKSPDPVKTKSTKTVTTPTKLEKKPGSAVAIKAPEPDETEKSKESTSTRTTTTVFTEIEHKHKEPEAVVVEEPIQSTLTKVESSEVVTTREEDHKEGSDNEYEEYEDENGTKRRRKKTITTTTETWSEYEEYIDEDGVQRKRKRVKPSSDSESETTTRKTLKTITTEIITERRSRKNIKFLSGWKKSVTLDNLFDAGVVSEDTVNKLEEGKLQVEDVEQTIQQYLVGDEPIGGLLIAETGEKMSIYTAWKKGNIRRGTSISLLEAQAATGRIIDPVTAQKMSVAEASKCGLIDRQFEAVLSRAERAVYGYKTRFSPETFSLFQAMKRGLVVENHGVRLLEAQIATGGIIDPKANHRLPVEVAFERGLFDEDLNQVLEDPSDDTRGFFDPNTQENLTYLELMDRCVIDKDTGLRLLPLRTNKYHSTIKQSKVIFQSSTLRPVMVHHVLDAEAIDKETATKFEEGEMSKEEINNMIGKLRVFVDGTMPIAGIINTETNEKMNIYEAAKCGLILKGTAFELLEAQACCGKLIDVQAGKPVSIESALSAGVIDNELEDVVQRAHRAVTGYRGTYKSEIFSLCEAISRHLIVRRHGIRLLEAQIATGGIVDIHSPVRMSVDVAMKKHLLDANLANELKEHKTKSYFDPVTGENLNYSELMARCVVDKDTNMLFLMVEGGTVTTYVEPFESEPKHKIRSRSFSPVRMSTEVVDAKKKKSRSTSRTQHMRTVEEFETTEVLRKKKRSTSSGSSASGHLSPSSPPAILSRKVVIVDPNTDEELNIDEARKRRLIDKKTYKELKEQESAFDEQNI